MALEAVEAALRQLKLFLEKGNRTHLDKETYISRIESSYVCCLHHSLICYREARTMLGCSAVIRWCRREEQNSADWVYRHDTNTDCCYFAFVQIL